MVRMRPSAAMTVRRWRGERACRTVLQKEPMSTRVKTQNGVPRSFSSCTRESRRRWRRRVVHSTVGPQRYVEQAASSRLHKFAAPRPRTPAHRHDADMPICVHRNGGDVDVRCVEYVRVSSVHSAADADSARLRAVSVDRRVCMGAAVAAATVGRLLPRCRSRCWQAPTV